MNREKFPVLPNDGRRTCLHIETWVWAPVMDMMLTQIFSTTSISAYREAPSQIFSSVGGIRLPEFFCHADRASSPGGRWYSSWSLSGINGFKPINNKAAVGIGTKITICRQLHGKSEELETLSKSRFLGKGWRENQSQNSPHYITRTNTSSKNVVKGAGEDREFST